MWVLRGLVRVNEDCAVWHWSISVLYFYCLFVSVSVWTKYSQLHFVWGMKLIILFLEHRWFTFRLFIEEEVCVVCVCVCVRARRGEVGWKPAVILVWFTGSTLRPLRGNTHAGKRSN